MKTKGKFKGHSRAMSVFPVNFEVDPVRVGRQPVKLKPMPLRDLIGLRAKMKAMEQGGKPTITALDDDYKFGWFSSEAVQKF